MSPLAARRAEVAEDAAVRRAAAAAAAVLHHRDLGGLQEDLLFGQAPAGIAHGEVLHGIVSQGMGGRIWALGSVWVVCG